LINRTFCGVCKDFKRTIEIIKIVFKTIVTIDAKYSTVARIINDEDNVAAVIFIAPFVDYFLN